jgi:membrane fusion protein, multidrug efflux system
MTCKFLSIRSIRELTLGRTAGAVSLLLLLIVVAGGCSKTSAEGSEKPEETRQQRLTNVEVQTLHSGELEEYLSLTGHAEAAHDIIVSSEQGGTVQELLVDRGDKVAKGQVLVKVSDDMYQARLDEARANLRLKQAALKKAKTLYERGSVTAMQRLQAQVEHDAMAANVDLAESMLGRAVIIAPISGVIDDRFVEQGEMVSPGGPLLRLVDRSKIKVMSEFSELDVGTFHSGINTEISFDALPGQVFQAKLAFVAASAEVATRTFPCEFHLPNPKMTIRGGMIARIRLLKELHTDVLVLPQTTMVETETGRSLFVLEGETAVKRPVSLGASNNGMVIVNSGLETGETVIVTGQRDLVDGQQVRVTGRKD